MAEGRSGPSDAGKSYSLAGDSPLGRLTREGIEQAWLERVNTARRAYQMAAADVNRALALAKSREWNLDEDGQQTLHRATKLEGEAIRQYVEALKTFTDLIVHGKVPPD